MAHPYLQPLIESYIRNADPKAALPMKKYMKERYEYYGIRSPQRKELDREFLSRYGKPPLEEIPTIARAGYAEEQREVQYFVNDLLTKLAKKLPLSFLETAEYLVRTKSWWDTVDALASNVFGPMATNFPELRKLMNDWIKDDDLWIRRTAILYQLKYRDRTDWEQLKRFCLSQKEDSDFFIRKAIGWSLREYSKRNAEVVIDFVNQTSLSNLSKREALKWLESKGKL